MKVKRVVLGDFATNCYLIFKEKDGILIDVGFDSIPLEEYISKKGITVRGILLTHTHLDHIGDLKRIREKFNAPVYVHISENKWLSNPTLNGSEAFSYFGQVSTKPAEKFVDEGVLNIGDFKVKAFHTPGHTPGGVSYYIEPWLFSGDTLFYESIGRTDLYGGDSVQLVKSIKNKLFTLPEDTIVYPGHGEETSIGHEKKSNPFLVR